MFFRIALTTIFLTGFILVYHDQEQQQQQLSLSNIPPNDESSSKFSPQSVNPKVISIADGKMFDTIGTPLFHNAHHFTEGVLYSPQSNILYESSTDNQLYVNYIR